VSGSAVLLGAFTVNGLPDDKATMTSAAHPATTRFQNGDAFFQDRLPFPRMAKIFVGNG